MMEHWNGGIMGRDKYKFIIYEIAFWTRMNTESRLALSAMRIASFLFLWLSEKICVLLNSLSNIDDLVKSL